MSSKKIALTIHSISIQTLIHEFLSLVHNNMCKSFSTPTYRLFLSIVYNEDKFFVTENKRVATLQSIINNSAKCLLEYIQ